MRDRRSEIMQRLEDILRGVVGQTALFRHREEAPEEPRPAILLNDGDENAEENVSLGPARGTKMSPVTMTPEIVLYTSGQSRQMAADLAELRRDVIAAVLNDTTLREIVGANGDIRYLGFINSNQFGRRFVGGGIVSIAITYPCIASEMV